jgi:hypothetical protein
MCKSGCPVTSEPLTPDGVAGNPDVVSSMASTAPKGGSRSRSSAKQFSARLAQFVVDDRYLLKMVLCRLGMVCALSSTAEVLATVLGEGT